MPSANDQKPFGNRNFKAEYFRSRNFGVEEKIMFETMKTINFADVEENKTYIVESSENIRRGKSVTISSEFEENFEFEHYQVIRILKIEMPYFVIKARHGREVVKPREHWRFFTPSEEFLKALKPECRDDDF